MSGEVVADMPLGRFVRDRASSRPRTDIDMRYRPGWRGIGAILLTTIVVVLFLGMNISILGLVFVPRGSTFSARRRLRAAGSWRIEAVRDVDGVVVVLAACGPSDAKPAAVADTAGTSTLCMFEAWNIGSGSPMTT